MSNKKQTQHMANVLGDSTFHGLPRILKSNSWLAKLMWMVCFCGSLGYCVYMIIQAVQNYLKYDTVMNTNVFKENPASFPVITICNLNQFQTNISFGIVSKYNQIPVNLYKNFFTMNEILSYNETFRQSVSFPFNETLINCWFNSKTCSVADFTWTFLPFYGS